MKKRFFLSLMVGALMLTSAMPVFATPKQMSDGTVFDVEYYATNNPDVVATLGTDEDALYGHYVNNGKNEGRKPCEDGATPASALTDNFDVAYYRDNNPDVVAVVGSSEEALYNHYINHGKNEGRKPCADSTASETGVPTANETSTTVPTTSETSATAPTASGTAVTLPEGSIQKVNRNLSPFPYELYTMYFDNKGLPYMYGRNSLYHLNGDHENPMDVPEWQFCLNTVNDYCRTMEDIYKRVPGYEDYYMPRQEAVGEVNGTHITLTYVRIFRGYDMGADLSARGILSTWP